MALPSGYKRLEYIQSSGTQYIDTGVSAPAGFRITCDVVFTSISNTLNMLFGSHDDASPYYRNFLAARSNGQWEIGAYNPSDFGSVTINTKYSIDVCTISGYVGCSINGIDQNVDTNIAVSTIRSAKNVYLFGLNYSGGLLPTSMKLYGLKMYLDAEKTTLVRDFIPCRTSDGTVGLWDDVNSIFYTNAGTGAFIGGPLTSVSLPSGYRRLNYIKSTGTQYIDTNFTPTYSSHVVMDVECTKTVSSFTAFFGFRNAASPTDSQAFNAAVTNATTLRSDYYGTNKTATVSTILARTTIDKNRNIMTGYGVTITNTGSTNVSSGSLILLAMRTVASGISYGITANLYSCQIYDNDVLVRDFVPCENSVGEIGLYDVVNNQFYGNSGTGTFGNGGYTSLRTGDILNYAYTGAVQSVTLPKGVYKLEVWGAQGGSYSSYYGGAGGYSVGVLTLTANTTNLFVYVGGQPTTSTSSSVTIAGGFNGGGKARYHSYNNTTTYCQAGGGGSDIRIGTDSLYARVIVAGGGGGSASVNAKTTKYGGGTSGGSPQSGYAASQTSAGTNGSFGVGADGYISGYNYKYASGGGGGGWYGGGAINKHSDSTNYRGYNGGGSGFVWTGSNAPSGYLLGPEYYLTDASTIAGNASMPSTSGGTETGHTGNGYARITVIKVDSLNLPINIGGTWKDANEAFVNIGGTWKTVEAAFVNIGGTWKELG